MRPGLGLGLGAFPGAPSSPLFSPRFDVQVDGGEGTVAFFAAARFGAYVVAPRRVFVPSLEAGARWHLSRKLTVGLAVGAGLAVFPDGVTYLIGATIEPLTWCFTAHHEAGVAISAYLPAGQAPPAGSPSAFTALVLPTVGYTFRF